MRELVSKREMKREIILTPKEMKLMRKLRAKDSRESARAKQPR